MVGWSSNSLPFLSLCGSPAGDIDSSPGETEEGADTAMSHQWLGSCLAAPALYTVIYHHPTLLL